MTRDDRGRFVPGHSGNPSGRPAGSVSLKTMIQVQLGEQADTDVLPDGLPEGATWAEVIVHQLLEDAARGHLGPIRTVLEYCDGKPRQAIDVNEVPLVPIIDDIPDAEQV